MHKCCILLKAILLLISFCTIQKCKVNSSHFYTQLWDVKAESKNSSMTRCFLCQVLPLNLDRKLAHKAKMAKIGSNASYGFGNEY